MQAKVVKYTAPTKHDQAPYRMIWEKITDTNVLEYWVQTSRNEEKPDWVSIGVFLGKSFEQMFSDDTYVDACWRRWEEKNDKHQDVA